MADSTVDPVRSARARLEAIQARREAQRAAREAAEEAANIEREALALEKLSDAEDEHGVGRVARVDYPEGFVIVRYVPSAHRKLMERLQKGISIQLLKECVTPCVVYPERERFAEIIDEWPSVLLNAQTSLAGLAGALREQTAQG